MVPKGSWLVWRLRSDALTGAFVVVPPRGREMPVNTSFPEATWYGPVKKAGPWAASVKRSSSTLGSWRADAWILTPTDKVKRDADLCHALGFAVVDATTGFVVLRAEQQSGKPVAVPGAVETKAGEMKWVGTFHRGADEAAADQGFAGMTSVVAECLGEGWQREDSDWAVGGLKPQRSRKVVWSIEETRQQVVVSQVDLRASAAEGVPPHEVRIELPRALPE